MLDVMFELPSLEGVSACIIDETAAVERGEPRLVRKKKAS